MVPNTKDYGSKKRHTVLVGKYMRVAPFTWESGKMGKNMDAELRAGQMVILILDVTFKIKSRVLECICGVMGEGTKEIISQAQIKGKEFSTIKMEANTSVTGKPVCPMELELRSIVMEFKSMAYGRMGF